MVHRNEFVADRPQTGKRRCVEYALDARSGSNPAAVFASANSLWEECRKAALKDASLDLSSAYNGWGQLMREVMRIGDLFERWSCQQVDFEASGEVWPYLLGDRFGAACLEVLHPTELAGFNQRDCLRVAIRLKLPLLVSTNLPVPVDLTARNPVADAGFDSFRIQTVRTMFPEESVAPFTSADDPYDPEYSEPYFGIYGVANGELEHICDRESLAEAITLVEKLAPGIRFDD